MLIKEVLMNVLLNRITKKGFVLICFFIMNVTVFAAEIHDLAKKGDIEKLKVLVKQDKTQVNIKDKHGKET